MENRIIKFGCGGDARIDDLDLVRVVEQSQLQQNYTKRQPRKRFAIDDAEWREKLNRGCCEQSCGFVNELTESRIDIAANRSRNKKEFRGEKFLKLLDS